MRLRQRRVDANQKEIVKALRDAGCSVLSLHRVGGGAGDLLVGRQNKNYLLEVKTAKGKLSLDEQTFQACWVGHYAIVKTITEALTEVGL